MMAPRVIGGQRVMLSLMLRSSGKHALFTRKCCKDARAQMGTLVVLGRLGVLEGLTVSK